MSVCVFVCVCGGGAGIANDCLADIDNVTESIQ